MAERLHRPGEDGTTLVELLVVTLLLGIVGTVTTVGLVTSFRTQLVATQGAETLDELRLSVQRMRDVVREADEVCASSTGTRLAVWKDRDNAGTLGVDEDIEVTIFEVDSTTNQLTRSVRNSPNTTLISDVIVTPGGDVFTYDILPTAQEANLVCLDGATVTGSTSDTARVDLDIDVQNANGVDTVETTTSMRVRNAGLSDVSAGGGAGSANDPPTAAVNLPAQCLEGDPCVLDGEGTDPESNPLTFEWDLDDDAVFDDELVEDPTVTFLTTGILPVALRVTDDQGQTATATGSIEVLPAGSNLAPVAAFTYLCIGATCEFNADDSDYPNPSEPSGPTESSDNEDAQGALTYDWRFEAPNGTVTTRAGAQGGPDQTLSFSASPTTVTLRVTDTAGAFAESTATISTSSDTIQVKQLKAVGSAVQGSGQSATYTATLTLKITTTTGFNRSNVQVSIDIQNANETTGSCTTGTDGMCSIAVVAPHNNKVRFTVDTVADSGGGTYDSGQSVTEIQVQKDKTETEDAP